MWVPNFWMYSRVILTAPCKIFKKWSAVETLSFLKKVKDQFPSSFVDSMPKYFCSWCSISGVMVECSCPGTSDLFMCQYGSECFLTIEDCISLMLPSWSFCIRSWTQYNLPHFPYDHIIHTYYSVKVCFWLQPFMGGHIYLHSPSWCQYSLQIIHTLTALRQVMKCMHTYVHDTLHDSYCIYWLLQTYPRAVS